MRYLSTLLLLLIAASAFAADVTGKWKATVQSPDGQEMEITINLKQDGEALSGIVEGPMGEMKITDGSMKGDAIAFTVEAEQFKVVHKGTVSGDEMKLKVEMGDQSFDMTAKRAAS
jgi:hypothetical protein